MPRATPPAPVEPKSEEIRGQIKRVLYTSGDFKVYLIQMKEGEITCAITTPQIMVPKEKVVIKGDWGMFKGKKTFKGKLMIPDMPKDGQGIIAWIKTGAVPKVGRLTGEKIVQHFGADAMKVIGDATRLMECIDEKKAHAIANAWNTNAMQPELIAYLGELGLGEGTMTKIIRRYGMAAKKIIRENPWQLAETIDGIGFATADDIARKSGHKENSPLRVKAGIRYALQEAVNRDGHTGLPIGELTVRAMRLLRLDRKLVDEHIWETLDGLQFIYDDLTELASTAQIHHAETDLVEHLHRLMADSIIDEQAARDALEKSQRQLGITLDPSQFDAAMLALTNNVAIITGGPGTGKSTTQKVIVHALKTFQRDIVLGAPTGRAAKRLAEVSGLPASTCHRLLSFDGEIGGFTYNSENPFKENWFIIDEYSMVDCRLAHAFTQAIPSGAGFTIVGDVDQLPSVGAGQVLRDLIESGIIPTARLTKIHRQGEDSGIVTAAYRINGGEHPIPDGVEAMNGFLVDEVDEPEAVKKRVVELMKSVMPSQGYDSLKDVQVLAAMRKGPVGVEVLNVAIKEAMNPAIEGDGRSVTIKGRSWTIGDRVMHIRNDYAKGVYNGEVGVICHVGTYSEEDSKPEPYFKVDYSGFEASYNGKDIDDVEQSWATTVHKSQGCEFPVVVMVCPPDHAFMLNRNLLYTGVTRAKTLCNIVGDHPSINLAVSKSDTVRRHTGLSKHLNAIAPSIEDANEPFIAIDDYA